MATVRYPVFLAIILVLQFYAATANFSPTFGNACQENVCGKGNCVASNNSTFGFECECDFGWTQARSEDDNFFKFLPCVIPNCSFNYNCANAPSPTPGKKANSFIFDPCFWADCGGGTCNKTSIFTYTCLCEEGYYNLFNTTGFPCYKQCAFGVDCENLGINLTNTSTSTPSSSPSSSSNSNSCGASLMGRAEFVWLNSMVTILAMVLWKYK